MNFFLDFKGKFRIALCCGSRQLCPGKKGNNGIQIEYFPDNFWVIWGLALDFQLIGTLKLIS